MNITPGNVLSAEHLAWLGHPVTQQMFKNLDKLKEHHVKVISQNAFGPNEIMFRSCAVAINTIDTVKSTIKDTNKFIQTTEI